MIRKADVEFTGFDDDGVYFIVRGPSARALAGLLGDTQGYVPNRKTAECYVTLSGERLTDEFDSTNSHSGGDDSGTGDLFETV